MGSQPDPANLPPGTFIHEWRVVEKLGQGSYGAVYHVELNGKPFALKMALHRSDSGDAAHTDARIRREQECQNLVLHPHILRVWSYGRWSDPREGFSFIVMDRVEGTTLAGWLEEAQPTFRGLVAVFEMVTSALAAAHGRQVLHRDIKPSNILVRGRDGWPFLTDFSVSEHPLAEELTDGVLPPGTRRYRSPEALRFEREHRQEPEARYSFQVTDDLFALGATLYDMLTDPLPTGRSARPPLNNETLPPPSPALINPRVPAALSDVTMALLHPDPRVRPPSSAAVNHMLAELKADPSDAWDARVYSPEARRKEVLPRPKARWSLRWPGRRLTLALGAGVLALLGGATALFLLGPGEHSPPTQARPPPPAPPLSTLPPKKENDAVSPPPKPPVLPSRQRPADAPAGPPKPSLKKCTLLIGTVAFLKAGCATVQLVPPSGECPKGAVEAMKKRRFRVETYAPTALLIFTDTARPSSPDGPSEGRLGVYENGPITGEVADDMIQLPRGTLLDGHLWVSAPGDMVFGRYTQARLPDGTTLPVCLEFCENGKPGNSKDGPGPREGTVVMNRKALVCSVDRWR